MNTNTQEASNQNHRVVKPRILYLDVAKAIAITLVCVGHATYLMTLRGPSALYNWIYAFHMPLFMLLSGYFSLNAFKKGAKDFFLQKIRQLIIPAIAISVLTVGIYILLGRTDLVQIIRAEAIGGMWFLKTLFACYAVVYIAKRLPISDGWLCLITVAIGLAFPHGYFLQFNYMLIFFWGGFFLRKHYDFYEKYRLPITIVSLVFFILFGIHAPSHLLTYDFILNHPIQLIYQTISSLAAALALIGLSYYLCRYSATSKVMKWIGDIGIFTLGIYGTQVLVLENIVKNIIHIDASTFPQIGDLLLTPLIGIASTIFCYYLVVFLKQYKWCNTLLFGGQYKTNKN